MTTTALSAAAAATLILDYMPSDDLGRQNAAWWQGVLGVIGYGEAPSMQPATVPCLASMTRPLGSQENLCEVWRVAAAGARLSNTLTLGRVHYRYCDDLLFGTLVLSEREIKAAASAIDDSDTGVAGAAARDARALTRATEIAYNQIFDVLNATGHQHLIRVWNYLPDINSVIGGDERYRHFNSARQTAFRNSGRATMGTVPAACALGSPSASPIAIYFIAGRRPPKMIENPRQTSAYHYPPKFGRHSPIFSRACIWGETSGARLFISGTASIVGHETIHSGNVIAQTRETMINISALLHEANRGASTARYSLDGLKFKTYVRRPADLAAIQATLAETLQPTTSVIYLQADICREDLLVEIEATGGQGLYRNDLSG